MKVLGAKLSPKGRRLEALSCPSKTQEPSVILCYGHMEVSIFQVYCGGPVSSADTLRDVFDGGHPELPLLYVKVQPSEIDHRSETTVCLLYQKQLP